MALIEERDHCQPGLIVNDGDCPGQFNSMKDDAALACSHQVFNPKSLAGLDDKLSCREFIDGIFSSSTQSVLSLRDMEGLWGGDYGLGFVFVNPDLEELGLDISLH